MNQEKLDHYYKLLLKEQEELIKELSESNESVRDLIENESHNVNDSVDEATATVVQNVVNKVSSNNQETLVAIESAIRRINEGNYGKCITCQTTISETRLEAIPWALQCIECKNKAEKRR